MMEEGFGERADTERHAVYSALSLTAGDEVLPELEAELHKTTWFSRSLEPHRQAIARCLARIGTPLARMILERGGQSKRAPVRKACQDALMGLHARD
jgi:HEAT repeat protein